MTERVGNEHFLSWDEACCFVGDKNALNETNEIYFRYTGFASVEMAEKQFDRVHVNGFLRIYPADVNDLRDGIPVGCNNALVNNYSAINGVFRRELLEKFIVFDDELVISAGEGKVAEEGEIIYPSGVFFRESDLRSTCARFGLVPGKSEDELNRHQLHPDRELDLLRLIGAMSCLLARHRGVDYAQEWHHLSDAFIDELFETMSKLGIDTEGKTKFIIERLIAEGVKIVHVPAIAPRGSAE